MTPTLSQKIAALVRDPHLQGEIAKLFAAELARQVSAHLAMIAGEFDGPTTAAPVVRALQGDRPGLVPLKSAHAEVGCSLRTIRRATAAGELRTVQPGYGPARYVERSELIGWAAKKFPVALMAPDGTREDSPKEPTRETMSS